MWGGGSAYSGGSAFSGESTSREDRNRGEGDLRAVKLIFR